MERLNRIERENLKPGDKLWWCRRNRYTTAPVNRAEAEFIRHERGLNGQHERIVVHWLNDFGKVNVEKLFTGSGKRCGSNLNHDYWLEHRE